MSTKGGEGVALKWPKRLSGATGQVQGPTPGWHGGSGSQSPAGGVPGPRTQIPAPPTAGCRLPSPRTSSQLLPPPLEAQTTPSECSGPSFELLGPASLSTPRGQAVGCGAEDPRPRPTLPGHAPEPGPRPPRRSPKRPWGLPVARRRGPGPRRSPSATQRFSPKGPPSPMITPMSPANRRRPGSRRSFLAAKELSSRLRKRKKWEKAAAPRAAGRR